jgi:hypothetical protein
MAADQDADDKSNGDDEPIVGTKSVRSPISRTVAIWPRPVVHLMPHLIGQTAKPPESREPTALPCRL